jgi:hypothetical protein
MDKVTSNIIALAYLSFMAFLSNSALADTLGSEGKITELNFTATSSDNYPLYHGYIVVKSKVDDVAYHWGGSYCPGKDLANDASRYIIDALNSYFHQKTVITPQYKSGQGGNLCLVSVTATTKK